ncbi:MAG: hypothetical protein A2152_01815 [Candidatus Levybacteria bacterium RBG_16_35_6]|nr:MAG: hypothetical protein A2152_01815 [Candidatus Levybacteria bacterium RBG_16_35_6]
MSEQEHRLFIGHAVKASLGDENPKRLRELEDIASLMQGGEPIAEQYGHSFILDKYGKRLPLRDYPNDTPDIFPIR